jgi:hypothetical protein
MIGVHSAKIARTSNRGERRAWTANRFGRGHFATDTVRKEKRKKQAFCPLHVRRRKASSLRSRTQGPGRAPAAAKALPVFKKKIRMERQQRMAEANPSHPLPHDTSTTTMIVLTADQGAALTGLLVNGIMDAGSNRVAALYRGILTSLSQLSPCPIEITDEMALAGAKTLAATIRTTWDGLLSGKVDPQFPAWGHGGHANAHQDDYIDLSRAIIAASLAARAES